MTLAVEQRLGTRFGQGSRLELAVADQIIDVLRWVGCLREVDFYRSLGRVAHLLTVGDVWRSHDGEATGRCVGDQARSRGCGRSRCRARLLRCRNRSGLMTIGASGTTCDPDQPNHQSERTHLVSTPPGNPEFAHRAANPNPQSAAN